MLTLSCTFSLSAGGRYWVYFQGHSGPLSPAVPVEVLAKRPEGYRSGMQDVPVCPQYLAALHICGFRPIAQSRWLNAVVLELQAEQIREVLSFPFVSRVEPVRQLVPAAAKENIFENFQAHNEDLSASFWAYSTGQLRMLKSDLMQVNRYTGKGVRIAVFDNGFPGVNSLQGFKNMRLAGSWDFVAGEADVFNNTGTHGTMVLSTLAAYQPGGVVGAAFDAEYLLLVTENDMSESLQEEYNWLMGAEWADSLGADIFTTSLGYTVFDDSTEDHRYSDLNGNTTVITRAGDEAAKRGILVINSAGNEGNSSWRHISAPADGDSIFAVGSVNAARELSSFSGRGPTSDGRIKPDMMAQGEKVAVLTQGGAIQLYNGTSFSGPLIAGLSAQLMEAVPQVKGYDLGNAIRQSGHVASTPNNDFGYGIPDAEEAFYLLTGKKLQKPLRAELTVFPNPARGQFSVSVVFPGEGKDLEMECRDLQGRLIQTLEFPAGQFLNVFNIRGEVEFKQVAAGIYFLRFIEKVSKEEVGTFRFKWDGN